MDQDKGLVVLEPAESKFSLLPEEKLRHELTAIRKFQNIVKTLMVKDLDYGVIPGTGNKPVLLKPGAEKLKGMHLLDDQYEVTERIENWDKPFFHYEIKCHLIHIPTGKEVSQGVGSCNSYESKFRYRWVYDNDIPEGLKKEDLKSKQFISKAGKPYSKYRIENEDVYSQVNTILKIAKKRAFIDALLSACRLSAVFTQDIEDMVVYEPKTTETVNVDISKPKKEPKKKSTPAKTEPKVDSVTPTPDIISEKQRKLLFARCKNKGINEDVFRQFLIDNYQVSSTKEVRKDDMDGILAWIDSYESNSSGEPGFGDE